MIFITTLILGFVGFLCFGFFIAGPRVKELKLKQENDRLMEEKERLLDREMLRTIFANHKNEETILENQLIKKMYSYMRAQSVDKDDGLQVKSNAEKILKVIGK